MEPKISVIIPAYNESKGIVNTVRVALEARDTIDDIFVIDDASRDGTAALIKDVVGIRLLINEKNQGKSRTVARGVQEATGDFVFFLDADLLGLTAENIRSLARPIKESRADVVISMRANTPQWMRAIDLDFMSGERIIPRQLLLENMEEFKKLRNFGLEVFLNRLIIKNKLRIKTVMMANVHNDFKWKKHNFFRGVVGELLMWVDILKTVSPVEFVRQNIAMKKLLVK